MASGKVVRSNVNEVPAKGRDTMGVIFAKPGKGDSIIGVAATRIVSRMIATMKPLRTPRLRSLLRRPVRTTRVKRRLPTHRY